MTTTKTRYAQRSTARYLVPAALAAIVLAAASHASAELVVFTIEKASSDYSIVVNDTAYGTSFPQAGGSLSSPVSGHFVVDFNPNNPNQIQFINGDGYITLDNTSNNYQPNGGAGQIGGQSLDDDFRYTIRNLVWDSGSDPLDTTAGNFDGQDVGFEALGGIFDYYHPFVGTPVSIDATGETGNLVTSATSFTQTSPGNWTVAFAAQLVSNYNFVPGPPAGNLTYTTTFVAHAQFAPDNITEIEDTGPQAATVNGGAAALGGIDLSFDNITAGGTLTAQVISDVGGLSQSALAALGNYQLPGGAEPQIWNIEYDGTFTGEVTLVFNYDPARVTPGSTLSIIHFNETTNLWENLGGDVDEFAHTITVVTHGFSTFAVAPEPSSFVMASFAACAFAVATLRRRKKS